MFRLSRLCRGVVMLSFILALAPAHANATAQPPATTGQGTTGQGTATTPPATAKIPPEEQIKTLTSQLESLTVSHKAVRGDLARCANIPERVMRLQCYDDLATELGFMTRAKKEEEGKVIERIGFWQVIVTEDRMGEQTMYLKLFANDVVRTGAATEKKPELVLRCYRKNTEVYLDWKSLLTENKPYIKSIYVVSRFDSENAMQKDWQLSLDKNATFAPNAIDFVRQMKEHSVLTLELTPYNMTGTTLAFTLEGFDKALEILVKRCYN